MITRLIKKLRTSLSLDGAYQDVFQTPQGREVLADIMRHGYVFKSTFVANDTNQTMLNEGKRLMALSIIRKVFRSQEELANVLREEQQRLDDKRTNEHEQNTVDA